MGFDFPYKWFSEWELRQPSPEPSVKLVHEHCPTLAKKIFFSAIKVNWCTNMHILLANIANNGDHCFRVIRSHETKAVGTLPALLCHIRDTKQLVHPVLSECLFGILRLSERIYKSATKREGGWSSKTPISCENTYTIALPAPCSGFYYLLLP